MKGARRTGFIGLLAVLVLVLPGPAAFAEPPDAATDESVDAGLVGDSPAVDVERVTGVDASPGPSSAPTVKDCIVDLVSVAQGAGKATWIDATGFVLDKDHRVGRQTCTVIADGSKITRTVTWTDPQVATDLVVAQAKSQLRLELPDVATSPPRGGEQLVGVPVWFWVANGEPVSTTATIPGLSATLTATLASTRIVITGGEGRARKDNVTLRCPHAGTPWVPGRASAYASSDCSHGFDRNGTYTVTATVTWNMAWTATNGQAGTLPAVDRTTTFTLAIHQAQAVTD